MIVLIGASALLNSSHLSDILGSAAGAGLRIVATVLWVLGFVLAVIGYILGKKLGVLLPQPRNQLAKLAPMDRKDLWRRFVKRQELGAHDIELLRAWKAEVRRQNRSAVWSVAGMVIGLGGASLAFPGIIGVILPAAFGFLALFLIVISWIERRRLSYIP